MTESEKLKLVEKLKKYISKNFIKTSFVQLYSNSVFSCKRLENRIEESLISAPLELSETDSPNICKKEDSILDKVKNLFSNTESTFQERLFEIIRERNIDEVELYTKAQITKQTFSKIRSNRDYKPTKNTAFLLVLALNLNLEESENLLSRAGIAFSPSDKFDLAIKFFIENKIYDIFEINEILLQSGIRTLAG